MARRLPALSLLLAWLCASGAMLDVAQVAAWARMFAGYVRTESVAAAARETFDPAKPCQICRAVSKARAAAAPRAAVPSAGPEKIILIFERSALLLACARAGAGVSADCRRPAVAAVRRSLSQATSHTLEVRAVLRYSPANSFSSVPR